MIKKLFHLFLLGISLAASGASKKEIQKTKDSDQMEKERFYYDVCCSAPRLNPGEFVSVGFIGDSGTLRPFGNNSVKGGMGCGMDGIARDRSRKYCLPKAIEATWVSYSDRKVYSVASLLPYDTILSLFNDGGEPCIPASQDTTGEERLRLIQGLDLCFMPEGKVVLYVKAPVKSILLDWSATGNEVTDDNILRHIYRQYGLKNMESYYDVFYSEEFSDYGPWRSYMHKHGSVAPLLERYLQRFNYTLNFEFENEETSVYSVESYFTNGEHYDRTPKYNEAFKMPSRLKEFWVMWDYKDSRYSCYMYINEAEVLKVFDEAYGGEDRTQKGELKIKVCKYNNLFDISLNVGDKSIKLEKTAIRVFRRPIENPTKAGELIYKNYKGDHTNFFADDDEYVGE